MPNRKNVLFFYKHTPELKEKVSSLKEFAHSNGFQTVDEVKDANIIVSIGGDNAFLQALRKTNFQENCLYVGVNTDEIGFYTDFTINEVDNMFQSMKNEQVEVRKYSTIEVKIDEETPYFCLNECSIRSNVIKTLVIDVLIDDQHFETFRGDGMIVSTPTGSTAYNKSVRGAVVDPHLPSMQVSEIASLNNNDYRTLGTSFLLADDRTLKLQIVQDGNDYPIIGLDNEAVSIHHAKQLEIKVSTRQIKVLKLKNNSFWEKVQRKFL
ncbi:NAD kinase [Alkalihalophilus pseudofirmus]|nr:NAD kinase [Alkalihalophilus pseudofirmus]